MDRSSHVRHSIVPIVAILLGFASPVSAMDWCVVPQLVPRTASDFDRISAQMERLTGCAPLPSDSAHSRRWRCDDVVETPKNELMIIGLVREPGQTGHLAIISAELTNMDPIRNCGTRGQRDGERFNPGNIALRDVLDLAPTGPRLYLTRVVPGEPALLLSDNSPYRISTFVRDFWFGYHGISQHDYPSTAVQLAGRSPIGTPARQVVSAFEERGSVVRVHDDDALFPEWQLTPPVGLGGVAAVHIEGMMSHVFRAQYFLDSVEAYEQFIALLDSEYGRSDRTNHGNCTRRFWHSGNVTILGEHCDGESTITFTNDVVADQIVEISEKLDRDELRDTGEERELQIDSDML